MKPTHRRSHQYPNVRAYMTPTPHTLGKEQSLAMAARLMREHGVRHLPVLDGGQLVGLLSERDVYLVESLPGSKPTEVRAEEAMVSDVLTTAPDAPLAEVVEEMVERKAGSAVVMEGPLVIGVLTTIDAMKALLDRLAATDDDDL
jgi:acetoin utilization protein AcuB